MEIKRSGSAYGLAQVSVAAPFEYTPLLLNVMWGFLIWQEIPTWPTVAGALLTLLSGLYILYREQKERSVKAALSKEKATHINHHEDAYGQLVADPITRIT